MMGIDGKVFMLLLICSLLLGVDSATIKTCEKDGDCAVGKFCYLKTNTCSTCTHCNSYQRQEVVGCAEEPSECGECLEGFQPEIFSDGRTRDLCIPIQHPTVVSAASPQIMSVQSATWLPATAMLAAGLGLLFLFAIFKWGSKSDCVKVHILTRYFQGSDGSRCPSSAVLFEPSAPPPSNSVFGDNFHCNAMTYAQENIEHEKHQCASKFLDPNYVKVPNLPVVDDPPDVVDGPPNNDDSVAHQLIDENTLPSNWTPGPEYNANQSTGPLITSFTGILQLNAANGDQPTNHSASSSNSQPSNSPAQHQLNVTNITVINAAANSCTGIFNISGN